MKGKILIAIGAFLAFIVFAILGAMMFGSGKGHQTQDTQGGQSAPVQFGSDPPKDGGAKPMEFK